MANTKVESFRDEEKASISFTKEMNEKRHAEALARAEAHKVAAAEKGAKMANTKVESLRDGEKASIFFAKVMNEKRHAQAALRAYSVSLANHIEPFFSCLVLTLDRISFSMARSLFSCFFLTLFPLSS